MNPSHLGTYKLNHLLSVADKTPQGPIIELGIYQGGTLYELAKRFPNRKCYGFDTFEGMPTKFYDETEGHTPGEFKSDYEQVKEALKDATNIHLIKGIFPDSYDLNLKDISFIHMDMDHGEPTLLALELLWENMVKGGIVLFDDYDWKMCKNIKPVVDSFAAMAAVEVHKVSEHQAYIVRS